MVSSLAETRERLARIEGHLGVGSRPADGADADEAESGEAESGEAESGEAEAA